MAIINTTVAKSTDVKDAALNLNAKAFELRRTIAGVWELEPSSSAPPESAASLDMKNASDESVVDDDERRIVPEQDFNQGGRYRSIVKLFLHYEFQKPGAWMMGTGWLVAPDLLVTAGHCSYDWSHKLGRATEVKAYIGYRGKDRLNDPNVQFRHAQKIVTTEGWLKTKGQKCFDVSFMKLDKPFTGIKPFRYDETPSKGNMELGVVGYPGDLSNSRTGEHGAFMYEMFLPTTFDLAKQSDTMLEYQIDTFGGNSGSPVLRQSDLVAIGAHVYGGTFNSASVIGKFGNPYGDYLSAFNLPVPKEGLNLIECSPINRVAPSHCPNCHAAITATTTNAPSVAKANDGNYNKPQSRAPNKTQIPAGSVTRGRAPVKLHLSSTDEEGFLEILKAVVRVGGPIAGHVLNTALPIALGPVGGPISALAGFALNVAGKLAESAEAESAGAESTADPSVIHEGIMERAILAEAVLTAVQNKELSYEAEESIFSDIKDAVMAAAPTVRKVAPHIMGAMMEPALRIALSSLHKSNEKAANGAESFGDGPSVPFEPILYSTAIDKPADHNAEAFLSALQATMLQGQESAGDADSEEGFLDVVRAGARFASKGLSAAAKHGLPILAQALASYGGAESVEDNANPSMLSADDLSKRALVAECTLQAVMKLPTHQLEEEGFFDFVGDVVKKIAPVAMKMAPHVIGAISPTVGKIVGGILGQESAHVGAPARLGAPAPPLRAKGALRKQPSQSLLYGQRGRSTLFERKLQQ